jgi:hypothetical protein
MIRVRWPRRAALLTALLLCTAEPEAARAVMAGGDAQQMGAGADLIARGQVQRVVSRWTADKSNIYTDVHFAIAQAAKDGAAGAGKAGRKEVVIRMPGGQVGDVVMTASDIEIPRVGQELVVVLAPAEAAGPAAGLGAESGAAAAVEEALGWYPVRGGRISVDGRDLGADEFMATLAGRATP